MNRFVVRLVAVLVLAAGAASAARAQDAAELLLRVNRLEGQVRQLSGQIEQLQFQNRRLEEQFRKFQEDVEFRFQDLSKGGRPAAAAPSATPPAAAAPARPAAPPATPPAAQPQKRGDAFDPSQQPTAPGAPRTLGTMDTAAVATRPGRGLDILADDEDEPGEPLDLSRRAAGGLPPPGLPAGALPAPAGPPVAAPPAVLPAGPGRATPAPTPVAVSGTGSAKDDFDIAYGLVLQRQYDLAEQAFRQFLQSWPRDRLAANATYWLGETYFRRARYTDAVEQYLKIHKAYGSSRIAPDSLYKMALSLRAMNEPAQACATLAEVARKYPEASAEVKAGVEREQRRGNC